MLNNKVKAEVIFELSGARGDSMCQNFLKLLDILIEEARIENDTTCPEDFRLNQGQIKAYKTIKDHIEKGLPRGTGLVG